MSEGFDICEVRGREILDSRGNPTCLLYTSDAADD